jgi:hypothetical protein
MSLYRYIPNPNAATSSITGPRTNLVQVPSDYADVALPALAAPVAAAAAPAAGQFGRALLMNLLAEGGTNLLGSLLAPGGVTPSEPQGSSSSKFMITLQDEKEIRRYVSEENYRRSLLNAAGGNYDYLDADSIIRNRENELRESAAQAGQRELQRARLAVEEATRPEIARAMGTYGTAAAQGLGSIAQNIAYTPSYENVLAEAIKTY